MDSEEARLIESTLEKVAELGGDITPAVYQEFFSLRPEASALFTNEHSMGLGQMLYEIFAMLIDTANEADYLGELMRSYSSDHNSFGVSDQTSYGDFLKALRNTIASTLGEAWTPEEKTAFDQQCARMVEGLKKAQEELAAKKFAKPATA